MYICFSYKLLRKSHKTSILAKRTHANTKTAIINVIQKYINFICTFIFLTFYYFLIIFFFLFFLLFCFLLFCFVAFESLLSGLSRVDKCAEYYRRFLMRAPGVRSLRHQMTNVHGVSHATAGRTSKRQNNGRERGTTTRWHDLTVCEREITCQCDDNSQLVHLFENRHVAVLRRMEQIKQVRDNEGGGNVVDQKKTNLVCQQRWGLNRLRTVIWVQRTSGSIELGHSYRTYASRSHSYSLCTYTFVNAIEEKSMQKQL